jgi:hypothetical protein
MITVCKICGRAYEEPSEETANGPDGADACLRYCPSCWALRARMLWELLGDIDEALEEQQG